jgi:hypothetical protein
MTLIPHDLYVTSWIVFALSLLAVLGVCAVWERKGK